jgi:response regulator NasT
MSGKLRIAVADDEPDMRDYLERILPRLGHQVVAIAEDGEQLVEQCQLQRPDLVITDIKMPGLDGIEAAKLIHREYPVPIILISGYHDPELIQRAECDQVMAYLVKPIKQTDLAPAIAIAMRRFEQLMVLRKETSDLRQALEDRKLIERAKGIIMRRASLGEQEAFERLQKLSSIRNQKLVETARGILLAEEAFALG